MSGNNIITMKIVIAKRNSQKVGMTHKWQYKMKNNWWLNTILFKSFIEHCMFFLVLTLYNFFSFRFRKNMVYGICTLCGRIKDDDDENKGKNPANSHGCQCPPALTCEHCKDKETDEKGEEDKYSVHRYFSLVSVWVCLFLCV